MRLSSCLYKKKNSACFLFYFFNIYSFLYDALADASSITAYLDRCYFNDATRYKHKGDLVDWKRKNELH